MSKDFEELTLTGAADSGDLVSTPGVISVSGNFGGGDLVLSMTGDDSNAPYVTFTSAAGADAQYIIANRLTFTSAGDGTTNLSIKWFPVRTPY